MVNEQEGCEWMDVSSGTGPPGQTRTKGRKTAVCLRNAVVNEKYTENVNSTYQG